MKVVTVGLPNLVFLLIVPLVGSSNLVLCFLCRSYDAMPHAMPSIPCEDLIQSSCLQFDAIQCNSIQDNEMECERVWAVSC